jgi:hypothetical protein
MASITTGTIRDAEAGHQDWSASPASAPLPTGVRLINERTRFLGVAARFAANDMDFEIVLTAENPARDVVIGIFDESEVVAEWRAIAAAWGLPLVMEKADGTRETAQPQIGRVKLGAIRIRRRHGLLSGRRPRFLVRRKTTCLPDRPIVYRARD